MVIQRKPTPSNAAASSGITWHKMMEAYWPNCDRSARELAGEDHILQAMFDRYSEAYSEPVDQIEQEAKFEVDGWKGRIDALWNYQGQRVVVEHKCLAGDCTIFDPVTGKYSQVRDLFATGKPFHVVAMTEGGEFVVAETKPLVPASVREIYEITTVSGRKLRVSGNHPIWTSTGWVPADQLVSGDWVATPKKLESSSPDCDLPDQAIRMIGYMIGDGSMSNMSFTKGDKKVMQDVVDCASHLGEEVTVKHPAGRTTYVKFSTVGPVAKLMAVCGFSKRTLSADKRIPFHLNLSDRQIGQLLGALWSTDGCVNTFKGTKSSLVYTTVSEGLACDIQAALQRIGITATARHHSVGYKGARRPVSQVTIVSRKAKRRFIGQIQTGFLPVLRTKVTLEEFLATLPDSPQGSDERMQPFLHPTIWWDKVAEVKLCPAEVTYDLEVPEQHTFVVDGIVTHNTTSLDIDTFIQLRTFDRQTLLYFAVTGADAVLLDIVSRPKHKTYDGAYKAVTCTRQLIYKTQADIDAFLADTEALRATMDLYRERDYYPRNPGGCLSYGSLCPFFSECANNV